MEYGFISQALLWLVGAMAVVTTVGAVGALWSMGRQSYRKS